MSASRSEADVGELNFAGRAFHVCLPLGSGPRAITLPMSGFDPKRTLRASHPITEHASREAGEDRREGRAPRPIRHVPDGRGCGAEGTVRRNPAADSSTPGAASTSVRRSLMPMLQQTTGEVRLADRKRRHQRAGVAVLTAIPTNSRRIPSRTALNIASADHGSYFLLTNLGSIEDCRINVQKVE